MSAFPARILAATAGSEDAAADTRHQGSISLKERGEEEEVAVKGEQVPKGGSDAG